MSVISNFAVRSEECEGRNLYRACLDTGHLLRSFPLPILKSWFEHHPPIYRTSTRQTELPQWSANYLLNICIAWRLIDWLNGADFQVKNRSLISRHYLFNWKGFWPFQCAQDNVQVRFFITTCLPWQRASVLKSIPKDPLTFFLLKTECMAKEQSKLFFKSWLG